uniref:RNase H type-1 domain-containing protein n=1 Tax=Chenopodium quinoa TaxID=63459 RepID=A0A803LJT5_CHEQI
MWRGEYTTEIGEALALLDKGKKENSIFGMILNDICHFTDQCNSISFAFVRRNGNKDAHALAKLSLSLGVLNVWLEDIPTAVMSIVADDIT